MGKKKASKKPETWDSVTADAHRLVYGDRGALYDHPANDYARVVDIFAAMTDVELSVPEAILFMKAVKISRLSYGLSMDFPPELLRDHLVDDAGYDECLWGALIYEGGASHVADGVECDEIEDADDE